VTGDDRVIEGGVDGRAHGYEIESDPLGAGGRADVEDGLRSANQGPASIRFG